MLGFGPLASTAFSEVSAASRILVAVAQLLAGTALSTGSPISTASPTVSLTGTASMIVAFGQIRQSDASVTTGSTVTGNPLARASVSAGVIGSGALSSQAFCTLNGLAQIVGSSTFLVVVDFRLYAATSEFISRPTDTPSDTPFWGTIQKALRLDRSIINGDGFGAVTSGWGELELLNTEGDYDDLIAQYGVDGRSVTVRVGEEGTAYSTFVTLYEGTAAGWHVEEDVLRVSIRDNAYMIEKPACSSVYAGTGNLEGLDDLKGKRKPRCFGEVSNVAPPLISMTPAQLVYQVNDGPIEAVSAVYDRGVSLTSAGDFATSALLLAATTGASGSGAMIEAGEYGTCLAAGIFKLGGSPAGQVTCNVKGDKRGGQYVDDTVGIVRRLLATVTDTNPVPNESSFITVQALQPAVVGYWMGIDEQATTADAIADLMSGIGGWGGFRRNGTFEIGLFRGPSSTPSAIYDRIDIIEIAREQLPDAYSPPPWRYRVAWGRNWTVQTDLTIDPTATNGITAERAAFVQEQFRTVTTDAAAGRLIRTNHPRAQDPEVVGAFFRDQSAAQAEADRRLALFGSSSRSLYRIVIKSHPFVHEIGETISVSFPRWDLKQGRNLVIVSLTEDTDQNQVELRAWG